MVRVVRIVKRCYQALALIPTTFAGLAGYNALKPEPDKEKARAWLFFSWTGYLCLPLSVILLAAAPATFIFDPVKRRPLEYVQRMWGRMTLYPFLDELPRIESVDKGYETMIDMIDNKQQPLITVSNHNSWLDIYTLFFLDAPIRFVSKKEIFYIPVVGWVMSLIGHMYLDRSDKNSRESLIVRSVDKLTEGLPLIHFFAEGTRSRDGKMKPFKIGAFMTAVRADVPVIPIQIIGTRDIMPETTSFRKQGETPLIIRVYPPIYPTKSGNIANDAQKLLDQSFNVLSAPAESITSGPNS